ncbi:hypothetical protein NQZ68_003114 [Dissostichus eleginoides]|nr:hypothetical protein NQZ68_003114 [Dissostichus eleginoides]
MRVRGSGAPVLLSSIVWRREEERHRAEPHQVGLRVFSGAPDVSCGRFTYWIMAQTNSGGQGTNGVADESPNMIVYRKRMLPSHLRQHLHNRKRIRLA